MIKKLLLGLGISFLSFIGFSNGAGAYTTVGFDSSPSAVNSSYDITFLKGGGLLTNYIGQGRGILALDQNILFWWLPDGLPYFYGPRFQGYFSYFSYCSSLVSGGTYQQPTDCNRQGIDENSKVYFKNFFSTIKVGDVVYYGYSDEGGPYWWAGFSVCFDSSEIGHSMCFGTTYHYNGNYDNTALVNSRGYNNLTFANLSNFDIGYAPGQNGYDGQYEGSSEGSSEGFIDNQLTGDYVYADCSWKDVLIALESEGYNRYICYGGLDNFDLYDSSINYNPIAGQGLSISQIWAWEGSRAWDNFLEWFTFWNGLYKDTTDNNYNAMWESYPAVYRTYFQVYNAYKGSVLDPRTVLEYCQLRTLTGDQLNNSAGGYFKPVCETIIREKQTGLWQSRLDGSIYSGGVYTGDVPIGVNWSGVGNMSGLNVQSDGLNFIQNYFNLAKSNLTTNYTGSFLGIVPNYIIVFMIALILFRFISH